ncbi:hypothetical protein Unana1_05915 [Umbelopsis nana]
MFASTKLSTVVLIGFALAALVNAGPVPNDASTADQGTALLGRHVSIPNTLNKRATCPSGYAACYDSYGGCCPYGTYCQAGSSYCYTGCGATAVTCADGGCCQSGTYCGNNGYCYSYY